MNNSTSTKVQNLTYLLLKHNFFPDLMEKQMNVKRHHFKLLLLLVFCAFIPVGKVSAQFHTPTISASLGANEYGTSNANNYVTGSTTWYTTWNDTDLFFYIQNANETEPVTIYLDVDPHAVVNGGSDANGTLVGLNYDNYSTRPNLPFRADIAIYCHNTYREIFRRNSSNGWTSLGGGNGLTGTTNDYTSNANGQYSSNANGNGSGSDDRREFRISWARLLGSINGGSRPSSFNWMGYVSYNNGMYAQVPVENYNGNNVTGNSNGIVRYFTVSSTANSSSTPPFSRNSFTQPLTATNNSFGAIPVWDFTMNSSGQQISRLSSGGDWTIGGTLTVGAGTIFFGSGGSGYGNTAVGNINVVGGTLNMDQTNKVMNVTGSVTNTGGTITLSGTSGGDLSVQGNITDNGTFNANNRAIFFSGSSVQNIQGSGVFDIAYVRINKGGGSVRMLSNLTCAGPNGGNAMELNSATSILDLNGFTLNLGQSGVGSTYNNLVVSTGVIRGSSTSNLNIFGTGALGTINFDTTTPGTTNALQNLTVNRTSTGTVTLGNAVRVEGTFNIKSGSSVTVSAALENNGSIIVENNANLIQTTGSTYSGTGTATVTRNSNALKRLDYTLWSSPVAPNQTLLNFSDLTVTPRFYQYNESSNQYNAVVPSATTFATGKGYLIRMPDQYPANSGNGTSYYAGGTTLAYPGVFTGVLNNGDIPVTLALSSGANKGFQAVGNPYPSVIDATAFINSNTTNIENTLYFWRKTNGAGGSAYATWTLGGSTTNESGVPTPNGKIQVGQGFIVKAKNAVTVSNFFNNAMRDVAPSSTQFFKTKQQAQKDRVWLNLTTTTGVFSQALIAYIDDAALGLDQYDGKYINDSGIALTTSIAGDEYTIQGRPAFDATDVVALNFKTSAAGTYSIAIDHVDGLFSKGQDIYLVDKTTGTTTNLNEGAYTFTAAVGVDNTRFTLTYQKTLKVDAPVFNENSVLVSRNNGTLNVKSTAVAINNVKVYDIQGRLVAERKNVKSNTATISNLRSNQVLIVKVTSDNNAVVTKKVLN